MAGKPARCGVDAPSEPGREARCAEDARRVLDERQRVKHPDPPRAEIGQATVASTRRPQAA